jgi:hypothetical protein
MYEEGKSGMFFYSLRKTVLVFVPSGCKGKRLIEWFLRKLHLAEVGLEQDSKCPPVIDHFGSPSLPIGVKDTGSPLPTSAVKMAANAEDFYPYRQDSEPN